MGEYERLISIIEEYIEKEDIVETDEVISAFDLYSILNNRFAKLRSIDNGKLKRKINKENSAIIKKIRNIRKVKTLLNYECNNVMPIIGDNKLQITFCFANSRLRISIGKNIGENDIYYISEYDKDGLLINKYYDDIMNIFSVLEEYYELFSIDKDNLGYENEFKVPDDTFDIKICCLNDGTVSSLVCFNEFVDKDRISENEYINKPSIRNILWQKSNQLLNKIPVQKSSLPPMFKQILDEREQTFVKKLVRK